MSFFECLKAFPEGSASASRMALTARHLGYQGIIICNREPDRIFMPRAADRIKGIEVAIGVEVAAAGSKALKRFGQIGPSFAPDAPFRTTGDEAEPTSLGGENQWHPSLPIVDVHDFDARKHTAWRERQLVSVANWRNRLFSDIRRSELVGNASERRCGSTTDFNAALLAIQR